MQEPDTSACTAQDALQYKIDGMNRRLSTRLRARVICEPYEATMATKISPHLVEREALRAWLQEWHDASYSLNARLMVDKFMVTDIENKYANLPVQKGKEAVYSMFHNAFKNLDFLHHEITYFDFVAPDHLYQATTIEYVVQGDDPDKDKITVAGLWSAWLVEEDGRLKVKKSEILLDASKVFERMAEKGLV